jgi:hypothetical protein
MFYRAVSHIETRDDETRSLYLKYARMPKMGEDISEIKNNKKLFGT